MPKYVLITVKHCVGLASTITSPYQEEAWFNSTLYRINKETGKIAGTVYTVARNERDRAISACINGGGIPADEIEIEAEGI